MLRITGHRETQPQTLRQPFLCSVVFKYAAGLGVICQCPSLTPGCPKRCIVDYVDYSEKVIVRMHEEVGGKARNVASRCATHKTLVYLVRLLSAPLT